MVEGEGRRKGRREEGEKRVDIGEERREGGGRWRNKGWKKRRKEKKNIHY